MANSLFDVRWIHGGNCAPNGDPPFQIFELDPDTFVLRQSKCITYEGNFLYVLFGTLKAILFDTGAAPDGGSAIEPYRRSRPASQVPTASFPALESGPRLINDRREASRRN
jgi:hypothetical protein